MIPGPDEIKQCPHCQQLMRQTTYISSNTFGGVLWTDGKLEAPMHSDTPWLISCPHCQSLHWIDTLEEIDQGLIDDDLMGDRVRVPEVNEPTMEQYLEALQLLELDDEQRIYIRTQYWWQGNDIRRDLGIHKLLTKAERENLFSLIELLNAIESDDDMLFTIAEAYRELGKFDLALKTLDQIKTDRVRSLVDFFRNLCKQKDPWVRKIEKLAHEKPIQPEKVPQKSSKSEGEGVNYGGVMFLSIIFSLGVIGLAGNKIPEDSVIVYFAYGLLGIISYTGVLLPMVVEFLDKRKLY